MNVTHRLLNYWRCLSNRHCCSGAPVICNTVIYLQIKTMFKENFITTSINSKKECSAKLTLYNDILTITIKPENWSSYLVFGAYMILFVIAISILISKSNYTPFMLILIPLLIIFVFQYLKDLSLTDRIIKFNENRLSITTNNYLAKIFMKISNDKLSFNLILEDFKTIESLKIKNYFDRKRFRWVNRILLNSISNDRIIIGVFDNQECTEALFEVF